MMKFFATILSFSCFSANATTYYFSNAGSDAGNGTSPSTTWQSVTKFNSFSFSVNDSILFNRGDSWTGSFNCPQVKYIGAYGSGNYPLWTGLITQAGFSNIGGNVWSASTGILHKTLNVVFINENAAYKARFPNTNQFLTYTATANTAALTTSLTGTPSYVGKEMCIRTTQWIWDITKITSQTGGNLTLSPSLTLNTTFGGSGYFFQNDVSFIDTLNEYAFDSSNGMLYVYSATTPTVQISTVDTILKIAHINNTVVENIAIEGANKIGAIIDTADNITVKNSSFNYCKNGISVDSTTGVTITNNDIFYCLNNGITIAISNDNIGNYRPSVNATVSSNHIKCIGLVAGMGASGEGAYIGITCNSSNGVVRNNTIDSIGYIGISWTGQNSLIKNNTVTNAMLIKTDGGGIYSYTYQAFSLDSGAIVRGNVIGNIQGYILATTSSFIAVGIYLDNDVHYVTVDSNTIYNCNYACFFMHVAKQITAKANLLIDSVIGNPIRGESTDSLTLNNNIYYQQSATTQVWNIGATTLASDSNYYLRPLATANAIHFNGVDYSYPAFVSATGYDTHGGATPTAITSNVGTLFYNPTNADSTITLPTTYIDVFGNKYFRNITLHSHTSLLVFPYIYQFTKSDYFLISH